MIQKHELCKNFAMWNELGTKSQIWYDTIYMNGPEQGNQQTHKLY